MKRIQPDPRDPRELLDHVVRSLGASAERFVFVGGATAVLHLTDVATLAPRPTKDVDAIVECANYAQYHQLGQEVLVPCGFVEDSGPGAPICRWRLRSHDVRFDVMPTQPDVLGLSGRWFQLAFRTAEVRGLPSGRSIRVASGPAFLATKLEAFRDRGMGDVYASHDMEDVITVVDGRPELPGEVAVAEDDLRAYLGEEFGRLLDEPAFRNALPGHLPGDEASQARMPLLLQRLEQLAGRAPA